MSAPLPPAQNSTQRTPQHPTEIFADPQLLSPKNKRGSADQSGYDKINEGPQDGHSSVRTLTFRQLVKKNVFWIVLSVFLVLVGIFSLATQPSGDVTAFSIENVQPNGSMAVAEVLRQNGVKVQAVSSFDELERSLENDPNSQVLLIDNQNRLRTELLEALPDLTKRLIVLRPGFQEFPSLGFGNEIRLTGLQPSDGDLSTKYCALDSTDPQSRWLAEAFERAGNISGSGVGFTITSMADGVSGCYSSESYPDSYSVVWKQVGDSQVVLLGHDDLLKNETITEAGNASVALQLIGHEKTLYWYMPGVADFYQGAPTLADLTPEWVTPIMILLLVVFIFAAIQSGRRMGPLVPEKLPVTVPAHETVNGRARMYQRSRSFDYVADQLRMGSINRLAGLIGMARSENYQAIIRQLSHISGRSIAELDALLISSPIDSEAQLAKLSQELDTFEKHLAAITGRHYPGTGSGTSTAPRNS